MAPPRAQPYKYTALADPTQEFRVLRLFPEKQPLGPTSPLEGELIVRPLSGAPTHEALSYRWQDPPEGLSLDEGPRICMNKRYHRISESLQEALLVLRYPDKTRNLWIDQVCINQKDGEEKGKQVENMGRIYGTAVQTLVWIGASSRSLELAVDIIRAASVTRAEAVRLAKQELAQFSANELATVARGAFGSEDTKPVLMAKIHEQTEKQRMVPLTRAETKAILEFYSQEWFTRTWVVQEVVLSGPKTVHCGKLPPLDWDDAAFFAAWFMSHSEDVQCSASESEGLKAANFIHWYESTYTTGFPLLALLRTLRRYNAGDARDKLYAALNMVDFNLNSDGRAYDSSLKLGVRKIPPELTPRYTDDWTVVHTYQSVAEYLIRKDNNLNILTFIDHGAKTRDEIVDLPTTWAPRWDGRERCEPVWFPSAPSSNFPGSGEKPVTVPTFSRTINVLEDGELRMYKTCTVQGKIIGDIKLVFTNRAALSSSETSAFSFGESFDKSAKSQVVAAIDNACQEYAKRPFPYLKRPVIPETLVKQLAFALTAGRGLDSDVMPDPQKSSGVSYVPHIRALACWLSSLDIEKSYRGALRLKRQLERDPHFSPACVETPDTASKLIEGYGKRVHSACQNRLLFRTSAERICLGPGAVSSWHHDVYLLRGCPVPMVLEKKKSQGMYKVIGPCYVNWDMQEESSVIRRIEWEDIVLA